MADTAIERLNRRLSGKNSNESGSAGKPDKGKAGGVQTIQAPGESLGQQARGKKQEKAGEEKPAAKKRGRPAGSKNKRKGRTGTAAQENRTIIEGVSASLVGIHYMGAAAFNAPEFELSEDEAEKIALSIQRVSDQYGTVVDPKVEAWVGLAGVLGMCYIPKVMAYNGRKARENRAPEPTRSQPQQPQQPPTPQPATARPPETVAEKEPAKGQAKDKGPVTPSDVFGGVNFEQGMEPPNPSIQ